MDRKLMKKIATETAKYLRHDPEGLGLVLDAKGWVTLEDLYQGFLANTSHDFELEDLLEGLEANNRNRFELTKTHIRAIQGHTTDQVRYEVAEPPESGLYVTYSRRYYESLETRGIVAIRKKYTKVFSNPLTAHQDAKKRRIKDGILVAIDTHRAYHDGTLFFKHAGDWYVSNVEASHLILTELDDDLEAEEEDS